MPSLEFIKTTVGENTTNTDLTDVFSDKYKNYLLVAKVRDMDGSVKMNLLDASNSVIATSTYDYGIEEQDNNGSTQVRSENQTGAPIGQCSTDDTDTSDSIVTIYSPNEANHTGWTFQQVSWYTKYRARVGYGTETSDTQCKGVRVVCNAAPVEITMTVFGIKDEQ